MAKTLSKKSVKGEIISVCATTEGYMYVLSEKWCMPVTQTSGVRVRMRAFRAVETEERMM